MDFMVEPWLRGPIDGVHECLGPALHALQQVREDVAFHTDGLTRQQIWLRPLGLAPVGFHLLHIGGSVDRLTTYLQGQQLTPGQLEDLAGEGTDHFELDRGELLARIFSALDRAEMVFRGIEPGAFGSPRYVGRRRLPTTTIGLAIHLAEHTQRHAGQVISATKLARAWCQR